jgi:hypothetical protein
VTVAGHTEQEEELAALVEERERIRQHQPTAPFDRHQELVRWRRLVGVARQKVGGKAGAHLIRRRGEPLPLLLRQEERRAADVEAPHHLGVEDQGRGSRNRRRIDRRSHGCVRGADDGRQTRAERAEHRPAPEALRRSRHLGHSPSKRRARPFLRRPGEAFAEPLECTT